MNFKLDIYSERAVWLSGNCNYNYENYHTSYISFSDTTIGYYGGVEGVELKLSCEEVDSGKENNSIVNITGAEWDRMTELVRALQASTKTNPSFVAEFEDGGRIGFYGGCDEIRMEVTHSELYFAIEIPLEGALLEIMSGRFDYNNPASSGWEVNL